ncbi:MAG: hypothetical protein AAFR52_19170, partial [Pseudomonadota bacterium]
FDQLDTNNDGRITTSDKEWGTTLENDGHPYSYGNSLSFESNNGEILITGTTVLYESDFIF